MKKYLFFLLLPVLLFACSKDNEPGENEAQKQVNEIASMLNGVFYGYKDFYGVTEHEQITFSPYSKPVVEEWYESGLNKNVEIYGECTILTYNTTADTGNEHLLDLSKSWKYNITIAYSGANPRLYFYPVGGYGKTEMHEINIINSSSFELSGFTLIKQ